MVELPLVLLSDESKQPLSILLTRDAFAAPYAGAAVYLLPVAVVVAIAAPQGCEPMKMERPV